MKKTLLLLLIFATAASAFEIKAVPEVSPTANAIWIPSSLPIPYVIDSKASDNVAFGPASEAIKKAFNSWQNVTGQNMRFAFLGSKQGAVANDSDGVNSVLWIEKDWEFSSSILAITRTSFLIQNPPNFVDADILFNGVNYQWTTTGAAGKSDIQSIAQHEIGHFIGIQHTQIKNAKMLPTGTPDKMLSADDQAAIRFLYPAAPPTAFKTLSPPTGAILLGGPDPASAGFPFITFRWSATAGLTNFVVQFSSVSTFSPGSKVKSFNQGTNLYLVETTSLRQQLKNLGGTQKKLFWRVRADSLGGQQTTPTTNFTYP